MVMLSFYGVLRQSRENEVATMSKKSFAHISEYIAAQPDERQPILQRIYAVIKENAPDAQERMNWQMPTFWQRENLIHFALGK
jgi:uncharacterized protein YdhG (YjbR/CyaY superfamily)